MQNPFANMKWWSLLWALGLSALLRYFGLNLGMWGSLGIIAILSLVGWFSDLKPEVRKWLVYLAIGTVLWQFGPAIYDWVLDTPYVGDEIDLRKTDSQMKLGEVLHPSGLGERGGIVELGNHIEKSEAKDFKNYMAWLQKEYDDKRMTLADIQQHMPVLKERARKNAEFRNDIAKFVITNGLDPNAQDVKNEIDTFLSIPLRYLFWFVGFVVLACYILGKSIKRLSWLPRAGWGLAVIIALLIVGDKLIWGSWGTQLAQAAMATPYTNQPGGPGQLPLHGKFTVKIYRDRDSDWVSLPPYTRGVDIRSPGTWLGYTFANGEKIGVDKFNNIFLTHTDGSRVRLAGMPDPFPTDLTIRGDGGIATISW